MVSSCMLQQGDFGYMGKPEMLRSKTEGLFSAVEVLVRLHVGVETRDGIRNDAASYTDDNSAMLPY